MKKPQMPEWLEYFMQELMKPPHFLDQAKQNTQPEDSNKEKESDNKRTSSDSETKSPNETTYNKSDEKNTSSHKAPPARAHVAQMNNSEIRTESAKADILSLTSQQTVSTTSLKNYIASQYGFTIEQFQPYENITRLHTSKGTYALKQTHLLSQNVDFINQALSYAKKNGFTKYARFAVTKAKKPFIRKGGKTYYLTSWIDGPAVNFASIDHIGQTAFTLAEFHESTRGFEAKESFQPQLVFNLAQITEQRNRDLRQMIHLAEAKENPDEYDSMLIELKPDLQDDAAKSLSLLQSAECQEFLLTDEERPGICHLDVIPSNFIYRTNHQVHMLDLDLATFAPRALDVAHLLRRSMQQLNWIPDAAYACFLNYNAVHTMPKAEYKIVNALLRFPYLAWRVSHTRYRFFKDKSQIEDLKSFKEQESRRQSFLEEFTKQIDSLSQDENT